MIDETLRASVLAPWGARVYEYDLQVDEFVIPKEVCSVSYLGTGISSNWSYTDYEWEVLVLIIIFPDLITQKVINTGKEIEWVG